MNQKLLIKAQLVILLCIACNSMNAQLAIGTPLPNASAMLDVESDSKGVLIPRVSLESTTDNTTITNGNVESLLVYNIQTINDVRPGYYYWKNNTSWVRLVVEEDIPDLETTTTLVDNSDGTMTYTDEDGTANLINTTVVGDNVLIADGTIDIDGDGTADTNVTLQDVIDNIETIVDAQETLTVLGISTNFGPDTLPVRQMIFYS